MSESMNEKPRPDCARNASYEALHAGYVEAVRALKANNLQMLQSNNDSEYAQEANELAIAALATARGLGIGEG